MTDDAQGRERWADLLHRAFAKACGWPEGAQHLSRVEKLRAPWLAAADAALAHVAADLRSAEQEVDDLTADRARLAEALRWIHDASERPICSCGMQTGTAAIKSHAARALLTDPAAGEGRA